MLTTFSQCILLCWPSKISRLYHQNLTDCGREFQKYCIVGMHYWNPRGVDGVHPIPVIDLQPFLVRTLYATIINAIRHAFIDVIHSHRTICCIHQYTGDECPMCPDIIGLCRAFPRGGNSALLYYNVWYELIEVKNDKTCTRLPPKLLDGSIFSWGFLSLRPCWGKPCLLVSDVVLTPDRWNRIEFPIG